MILQAPNSKARSPWFSSRRMSLRRTKEQASLTIQQYARALLTRKKGREETRRAASKVQAFIRGHLVRRSTVAVEAAEVAGSSTVWFKPRDGWPEAVLQSRSQWKQPPKLLMPTAVQAPALFDDEATQTIGSVRLEILEAEGLPRMDVLTASCDPYALVIFEGSAAQTNALRMTRRPRWPTDAPRAFEFPVRCPYSNLYVGILDHDDVESAFTQSDGLVGRVVLELGSLFANTVYDTWMPLQRSNIEVPGSVGAVRLRCELRARARHPFESWIGSPPRRLDLLLSVDKSSESNGSSPPTPIRCPFLTCPVRLFPIRLRLATQTR